MSKGRKIQKGPPRSPKWYKTKHLARVQNGPWRGGVHLKSKIDAIWRFRSSKNDEKPRRILRILLFSTSGFSDRLWQKHTFRCRICTSSGRKSRSKEAREEPPQCKMCSLTQARSKIKKTHSFAVDAPKGSFWRQVPYGNAILVSPLEGWIFQSYTF